MIAIKKTLHRAAITASLISVFASVSSAQFGGVGNDVVVYTVTYNGSADFQYPPVGTVNTAANLAGFKKVPLDTVPFVGSDPFPLQRQVFMTNDKETFQVGTDFETTVGLHRIVTQTTKIFVIEGSNLPTPGGIGQQNNLITFPQGLDVADDIALEDLRVVTFFGGRWPFIAVTDKRGSLGPPDIPGFQYLFQIPGAVKLPSLIPWTPGSSLAPTAGWKTGADVKVIDEDKTLGSVIREIRLRPGIQTPSIRTAGHVHMFVLQGNLTVTPAGGAPVALNKYDYVYLPENFTVTLSNPAKYAGPVKK